MASPTHAMVATIISPTGPWGGLAPGVVEGRGDAPEEDERGHRGDVEGQWRGRRGPGRAGSVAFFKIGVER